MEASNGRVLQIGGMELRFLVTEPGATVFEMAVAPGAKVPVPHYHRDVDECVYGLSGITTVRVDGKVTELTPGNAVFIPRGTVHYHENRHGEVARSLVTITPGTIGLPYFEEIAALVSGPGRPDPEKLVAAMLRHGLVPA